MLLSETYKRRALGAKNSSSLDLKRHQNAAEGPMCIKNVVDEI